MADPKRARLPAAGQSDAVAVQADGAGTVSHAAIWTVVAALVPGHVVAYGEIARRAGLPRRARLVAQALKSAPAELALPWHRVIRADGRIAFPPGSDGFRRQRRLLLAEGVAVADSGRVTTRWRDPAQAPDLDSMLWAP
jgi:methylated-DNA-protein-cysteine methyltransferase-like protein